MRTIRFSQHKSFDLRFTEKIEKLLEEELIVSSEELYSFTGFSGKEKRNFSQRIKFLFIYLFILIVTISR